MLICMYDYLSYLSYLGNQKTLETQYLQAFYCDFFYVLL